MDGELYCELEQRIKTMKCTKREIAVLLLSAVVSSFVLSIDVSLLCKQSEKTSSRQVAFYFKAEEYKKIDL